MQLLALVMVLALLISDTAACFASGLARCLALTATAVLCAFAEITSLNCLDMFHDRNLHQIFVKILSRFLYKVNSNACCYFLLFLLKTFERKRIRLRTIKYATRSIIVRVGCVGAIGAKSIIGKPIAIAGKF